jgi:hypothetical protein
MWLNSFEGSPGDPAALHGKKLAIMPTPTVRPSGIVLVAALAAALCVWLPASACSCAGPRGDKALPTADAVFLGKVTAVQMLDPYSDTDGVEPRMLVSFEVSRYWKGSGAKQAQLQTFRNKWSCSGYHFATGREYLVVAHRNPPATAARFPPSDVSLGVDICGATRPAAAAEEDLRLLGEGQVPQ